MKHIINGREWRLAEEGYVLNKWNSNYLCADNDGVNLFIYGEKLELQCFSGIMASWIEINQIDFPYLKVELDHRDPFEVQCLHIADYFCRLFCTWKED